MDIDVFFLHQQFEDNEIHDQQQLASLATTIILLGNC
jgi:hypothetical protein